MTLVINESEAHLGKNVSMMCPYNKYHECLMSDSNTFTKDEEMESHSRISCKVIYSTYTIQTCSHKQSLTGSHTGMSLPDFYKCHQDVFTSRNTTG